MDSLEAKNSLELDDRDHSPKQKYTPALTCVAEKQMHLSVSNSLERTFDRNRLFWLIGITSRTSIKSIISATFGRASRTV